MTKDIPEGTVYAGNPAHYIYTIEEFEKNMYPLYSRFPFIKDLSLNGGNCLRKEKTT